YAVLEDVVLDKKSLSNRELANLWQLAELLNKCYLKINNQAELLFWFKDRIQMATENLISDIDADNEELIRLENDDEQIIITTQHKAKGMEYEILFCPYFKNNITLDGQFDFNYKRPFFSSYRKDGKSFSQLVVDPEIANLIVEKDNKEVHRLNYVALTRAKSRIYIYLKQHTITKATSKYDVREKPDKLTELFGYVKSNSKDRGHLLFNYPEFFSDTPQLAIKDPKKFPGVIVYNRDNLTEDDLQKLTTDTGSLDTEVNTVISDKLLIRSDFTIYSAYYRQSYSGLTKMEEFDKSYDYYEKTNEKIPITINYKYKILSDKNLSGAVFGTLFHELCEIYPFTPQQLSTILQRYNVENSEYQQELSTMVEEAFNYPLLDGKSLNNFKAIIYELEFNLTVKKLPGFHKLINKHFCLDHPFSIASKLLNGVSSGFLLGFMDVCFMHKGRYWVLDYKTNSLSNYTGATIALKDSKNLIVESMAEHHYYLQYLLYLVALKRYLQVRLKIKDASDLIGGSVYYYVRGIYTENPRPGDGVFIDDTCQKLVSDLDKLLDIR
ncbi:MAG: hypothetical protein K0R94_699, partial [Burkholderiales bacterium]|nr:hypothetical protein [Burkholderiales bacterium]